LTKGALNMSSWISSEGGTGRSGGSLRISKVLCCGLLLLFFPLNCGKPRTPASMPPSGSPPVSTAPGGGMNSTALPLPQLEIRIEPPSIQPGDSALLIWETKDARKVTIGPAIGNVDPSGRIRIFPERTTTYTVEAEGGGGTVSDSVTVEVLIPGTAGGIREEDLARATLEERFKYYVQPVFFDFDSARLTDQAREVLDRNIRWLMQPENRSIEFIIEGHADERGSEEYNLALGDKRAQVVAEYLAGKGISRSRMLTVSLGEERPFDTRRSEAAFASNRRAHFVLLKTGP